MKIPFCDKNCKLSSSTGKLLCICALAAVLLISGVVTYLTPAMKYSFAGTKAANGDFDGAYSLYVSLGDYKDCADKAIETVFAKAQSFEAQELFIPAAEVYESIPEYEDSLIKAHDCRCEASYREAKAKVEAGDYAEAKAMLTALEDYKDATELFKECIYLQAESALAAKQYNTAYEYYRMLPDDYSDAADKAKEAKYQYAEECMLKKAYKDAIEAYDILYVSTNNCYKDSNEKYKEAKYQYAEECLASKAYEEAYDAYSDLLGYKDCSEKFMMAAYAYGVECYNAHDYLTAMDIFLTLDYKDSFDYLKQSSYYAGIDCLNNKEYLEAEYLFYAANGFKDAKAKRNEAMYGYVKANFDSDDIITYDFLVELKQNKYSNAKDLYEKLYAWKVIVTAVNSSESSILTDFCLSRYDRWYFHIKLEGGPPDGSTALKAVCKFPDGTSSQTKWDEKWENGWSGWCAFYYKYPERGAQGTATVTFYDGSGNKIGRESVEITYY